MKNFSALILFIVIISSVAFAQVPTKDKAMYEQTRMQSNRTTQNETEPLSKEKSVKVNFVSAKVVVNKEGMKVMTDKLDIKSVQSKEMYVQLEKDAEMVNKLSQSSESMSQLLNSMASMGFMVKMHSFAFNMDGDEVHYYTFAKKLKTEEKK